MQAFIIIGKSERNKTRMQETEFKKNSKIIKVTAEYKWSFHSSNATNQQLEVEVKKKRLANYYQVASSPITIHHQS